MLCAHCYDERLGVAKKVPAPKGDERQPPIPLSPQARAS